MIDVKIDWTDIGVLITDIIDVWIIKFHDRDVNQLTNRYKTIWKIINAFHWYHDLEYIFIVLSKFEIKLIPFWIFILL